MEYFRLKMSFTIRKKHDFLQATSVFRMGPFVLMTMNIKKNLAIKNKDAFSVKIKQKILFSTFLFLTMSIFLTNPSERPKK
jgi:hypothetical protein